MIAEAWDRYRGWANRARTLQATDSRDKAILLIAATATAVFGALATIQPKGAGLGNVLGFLAAACATIAAILGRELLSAGREAKWIRARATAEAIKSECFLAAAGTAGFTGKQVPEILNQRISEFEKEALDAGITPLAAPADDNRPPPPEPDGPRALTTETYRQIRLQEQRDFYERGQLRHEKAATRLRIGSTIAAVVAAVLGLAAGVGQAWLASWIGAVTTVAAAVAAWGMIDRHAYLAASYGAMGYRLRVLDGLAKQRTLPELAAEAEDLLRGEHTAWAKRMAQPSAPAAQAAAASVAPAPIPDQPKVG